MKLRLFYIISLSLFAFACNKDKFTTIPQYRIKSISPETVVGGDLLTLRGTFTDKEGDIDSVFVVLKYFDGATATYIDTIERFEFARLQMPPKTMEAELNVQYAYNFFHPDFRTLSGVTKDTTAALGIILQDKVPNRSEYQESPKVRLTM